jgi:hypothetical protein
MKIDCFPGPQNDFMASDLEEHIASAGLPGRLCEKLRSGVYKEADAICYVSQNRNQILGGRLVSKLSGLGIPGFEFCMGDDNQILVRSDVFQNWFVIESKHYYAFGRAKQIIELLGGSWT